MGFEPTAPASGEGRRGWTCGGAFDAILGHLRFECHSLRCVGPLPDSAADLVGIEPGSVMHGLVSPDSSGFLDGWPSGLRRTIGNRVGLNTLVGSNPTPSVLGAHTRGGCGWVGGAWLSPVERCVRVAEVPGSNPGAPMFDR